MQKVTLNGTWMLKQKGEAKKFPAQIPGSVFSTLLDAGEIPDPYDRMNEYSVRDRMKNDYCFFCEFTAEADLLREEQIELVCEGLDTLAEIYLNGEKIFYADNMHRTWRIPVKSYLHPGINTLSILFLSVFTYMEQYVYPENKEIHYTPWGAIRGNHLLRKAHSMFGWDWGPQLPDGGIFRDIYLEGWTGRRIQELFLSQKILNLLKNSADSTEKNKAILAEIHSKVTFSSPCPAQENQSVQLLIIDNETGKTAAAKEEILEKQREWTADFTLENPKLWWPNGYGKQPLYTVCLLLKNPDGSIAHKEEKTIGLRELTVSREKDSWGREFAFMVNGIKIFAMGANYIPEDCLYSRITPKRQDYLLTSAKRANMNCIRVWGGGYYPSDAFYDLCDQKGLIVWQDFMFACNVYDASDAFLENCRQEIIDNVKRLRHHPCLGLWCGNNEIESAWFHWPDFQTESPYLRADYIRLFEHLVPHTVKEADPNTFFWPSSPSSGGCFANPDDENNGDAHYWDVWHGQKPFTDYRKYFFRFCSEFGFQSFPCLKTIESFARKEDQNIFSQVMESHQKNNAANGKILYYLSENFRYPNSFAHLLYVSQILQGMAIQYGVEHWRRNRGRCMGTLYWQLNDNWPVASWSSIDYFGRWKALHYMARRFFAPTAASITIEGSHAELFIVNESPEAKSWKAKFLLKTMDNQVLRQTEAEGLAKAFYAEKVMEMEVDEKGLDNLDNLNHLNHLNHLYDRISHVYLESQVIFSDRNTVHNVEPLVPYKHLALKKVEIETDTEEKEDAFLLRLKSNGFAPFIELSVDGADVIFSDNYFHLTENTWTEVAIVKSDIVRGEIKGCTELKQRLRITTLRDTF